VQIYFSREGFIMATESGHARNVQYFEEMLAFAVGWGVPYDPTNAAIQLAALQAKLTGVNTVMDDVIAKLAAAKVVINDRENEYLGIRKLVTRVVNYYESTGTVDNNIADARSLKRKIDGKRAETLVDNPETPENEGVGISVSQQSYTQILEFFDALIELLKKDPLYAPNEPDLTIVALEARSAAMSAANTAVINANVAVSLARGSRDAEMYAEPDGMVDRAMLMKKYVKAAFGTDSLQYGQVKGYRFSRPR
jgi:hypothetical protein